LPILNQERTTAEPLDPKTVATTKGDLDLGPWEQIFYGGGRKRVLVKIIGE